MITIICDMCGDKICRQEHLITVEFNHPHAIDTLGLGSGFNTEKHLCVTCATRLLNWMQAQLEKGGIDSEDR